MATISGQRSLVALASATSANGTARNGATLPLAIAAPLSLVVEINFTLVTASVVGNVLFQVSNDGTNFFDMKPLNNAAYVTAPATTTSNYAIAIPDVSAYRFFRVALTLSGATTAAGDLSSATYRFRKPGYANL